MPFRSRRRRVTSRDPNWLNQTPDCSQPCNSRLELISMSRKWWELITNRATVIWHSQKLWRTTRFSIGKLKHTKPSLRNFHGPIERWESSKSSQKCSLRAQSFSKPSWRFGITRSQQGKSSLIYSVEVLISPLSTSSWFPWQKKNWTLSRTVRWRLPYSALWCVLP